jgi:LDH2 family malate/lactate/ureidoglycolate dehydrogenase
MVENARIDLNTLKNFAFEVFIAKGFSIEHATIASNVLVEADARGIDSHGVARLEGYVRLIDKGRINPVPNIHVVKGKKAALTINADKAIGLIAAQLAMKMAIENAHDVGSCSIAVMNSNHFGIASAHTELACNNQMIGIAMTNASPLVATFNTAERLLGTNPMCFSFPRQNAQHLHFDMATASAANGKLEIAERKGLEIPEGWMIMPDGSPCTDPAGLKKGASLLPLGSYKHLGIHKGYGLASVVDLLSGVLPGAAFGPWVPPFVAFLDPKPGSIGKGIGHFFSVLDIESFTDVSEYNLAIEKWIETFKNAKPLDPTVELMVHGEPEWRTKENRSTHGIPLNEKVYHSLVHLAKELHLSFNLLRFNDN